MGVVGQKPVVSFGPLQLDLRTGELRRNGVRVRVPHQSIQVLTLLLERPGELITREELHHRLWPNGTIVEFDHSINAVIKRLRQALEDSADNPKFIETLPRHGYRFLFPVEQMEPAAAAEPPEPEVPCNELTGKMISRYRILRELGHGAMGIVYEAEDTKLGRSVALKFLPEELSDDPKALERFEREARAASALNHPNIVSVHDIGRENSNYWIVTELVQGETLCEMIARGPLAVRKTIEIAAQIADGLASAHRAGIVHRDLKPSNIIVSPDGYVKIIDFGLATQIRGSADASAMEGTKGSGVQGTAGYMSPEQIRAQAADHRSDIFSLGVILYEMLAGKQAFSGSSSAQVMNAILNDDPPALPQSAAPALERILRRCMEKEPGRRFQSAADLEFALAALTGSQDLPVTSHRRMAWLIWIAACVLVPGPMAYWLRTRLSSLGGVDDSFPGLLSPTQAPVASFTFLPPFKADAIDIAVSPDGRRLAFTDGSFAFPEGSAIWLRPIDSFTATTQKLPGTDQATRPFWSPDGRSLGFCAKSGGSGYWLRRVNFFGAQSQVQPILSTNICYGSALGPRAVLYSPDQSGTGLYRVSGNGENPVPVTTLNSARSEIAHRFPQFLPDGRHFIYWVWSGSEENTGIYVGSLDPGEKLPEGPIVRTWREARYAEPGYLLYLQGSRLVAQRFDPASLRLTGETYSLPETVGRHWGTTGMAMFSASPGGVLAYQEAMPQPGMQIVWRNRAGKRLRSIEAPPGSGYASLDPDEKRLVLYGDNEDSLEDLWVVDLERGASSRLTATHQSSYMPFWSQDGRHIAFRSNRTGVYDLYMKNANGVGGEELLVKSSLQKIPSGWSPDGRFLVYDEYSVKTKGDIWVVPLEGERKPFPFLSSEFFEGGGTLSPPDSRGRQWMAYGSDETGQSEIHLRPFHPGAPGGPAGPRVHVSTGGGFSPKWRKDGRELFYTAGAGTLMAVDVKLGELAELGTPHILFELPATALLSHIGYTPFADGQRFLFVEPAGDPPAAKIKVVLNWQAELKR